MIVDDPLLGLLCLGLGSIDTLTNSAHVVRAATTDQSCAEDRTCMQLVHEVQASYTGGKLQSRVLS